MTNVSRPLSMTGTTVEADGHATPPVRPTRSVPPLGPGHRKGMIHVLDLAQPPRLRTLPAATGPALPGEPDIGPAKAALRDLLRARRRARPEAARQTAAHDLSGVFTDLLRRRRCRRVGLYVSHRDEPGTGPLRAALAARGVQVLLPEVTGPGELSWLPDRLFATRATPTAGPDSGRTDAEQAAAERAVTGDAFGVHDDLQVLLVPALAVDTLGRRLGRGVGCYDRLLRRIGPDILVLAAVFDEEVFDAAVEPLPEEPHDSLVAAAITPSRVVRLAVGPRW